jgi:prepilin-type N-terminal cleavage/methylation domain-containing protein
MIRLRHRILDQARAAFTLIELLAVILIIGILATFLTPRILEAVDSAKVTACKANMREIYNALTRYQDKFRRVPTESGARFLAILVKSGCLDDTRGAVEKLTCPNVDIGALTIGTMEPEDWFKDLESVDGTYTSYAGRDQKNSALTKFPGSGRDPLVADDNDTDPAAEEGNHRTATVVLYADGTVGTHELFELHSKGILPEEVKVLKVGSDSPVAELQKLTLD